MPAHVILAPDSFKGTATALEVAEAVADGWRQVRPADEIHLLPMADGGEGTLDAFAVARPGAQLMPVTVVGPDNRPVATHWLCYRDDDNRLTALVELACTSGITLLDELRPGTAHTRGFGQAIRAALEAGVERLVLAIGGSCSTDGGAGMLAELGAELRDATGTPIADGYLGLSTLATVDLSRVIPPPSAGVHVLTDVTNPLLGGDGAVAVFGPQKGITPAQAPEAEAALEVLVAALARETAAHQSPGAGAAGGTGFGLLLWGAALVPGAEAVADEIGLTTVLGAADIVITGEGRYDDQSEQGKVASFVRQRACASRSRTALVAGLIDADPSAFDAAASLTELAGSADAAMADPLTHLQTAGTTLARAFGHSGA